ncbi:KAT8 regulatory NSL complex subunit 2 [Anopheles ziemanni]|uniref:KAT8 regulatory NSL complex subunit 2 n=1 Tax=Anopheles ziemanni TaxID=345580 RepID=UPI002658C420|nr:KAT8 regulatory NSL complex subunit 2 isoform X2 [Anopheles coustani]XP_058178540.1 KAT8 regulatory NSL complex subunit 2 [Anopheles ziemanni]
MGPVQQVRPINRSAHGGSSGTGIASSSDQEESFRCQIHQEIERKAKVCANTLYECSLPRVESYAYCIRHILQDPKAPYKQCGFFYPNGRRCPEPSPRYDAKKDYGTNYCFEHSRQTQLSKTKSTIGKLVPVETTETLLHSLAHHVKVDKTKQHYMGNNTPLKITVHEDDDENDVDVVTPSVDPFVDVDVTAINDSGRIVLDYASDSSSEDEETQQPTYGTSWRGQDMDNSDNESVDSQCDDPLKHAGIYTAEETTRITKEKLARLQSLYVEQIHRLQHVLRERRRNFLRDQRAERETHCSIYDQINETPHERALYEKLKGLNRYHRKHGVEAILQRKYLEKRAKATEGLQQKPPPLPKCSYTEGGVKCGERTLPCCKHCRKHILEDKKQVLFRACGIEKSGIVCQEPLAGLFENVTCPLHFELPAQRSFNKRKYESESEGEAEPSVTMDGTFSIPADHPSGVDDAKTMKEPKTPVVQDDKKKVRHGTVKQESKPSIKSESKRKSFKQEAPAQPRVRNTRATRAALGRRHQQDKTHETLDGAAAIKQEKEDPPTIDPTVKDEDEEQLPVTIIQKKKLKLEEETVEKSDTKEEPMDTTTTTMEEQTREVGDSKEAIKEIDDEKKPEPDGKGEALVDEKTVEEVPVNPTTDEKEDAKGKLTEKLSIAREKSEPDETKTSHSSPEPSKRRRVGLESREQSLEKNKDTKEHANTDDPSSDLSIVEGKSTTASDEEKADKVKQEKANKGVEKSRRQPK